MRAIEGEILFKGQVTVSSDRVSALARALGGSPAPSPATELVLFFGPTVVGERLVVDGIELNLSRALLGSQTYDWIRPFRFFEEVEVLVFVQKAWEKNGMQFVIVESDFRDSAGDLIQRQTTTFIERQGGP